MNNDSLQIWQQGYVKGNQLFSYDRTLYSNVLNHYNDKQVEFCIKEKSEKPTPAMHNYYRGVILATAKESEKFRGWSKVNIHKYFASQHLKDVIELEMNGLPVIIVTTLSTSEINRKRMIQFIDDVRQELAENGIVTIDPEVKKRKWEKEKQ